VSDSELTSDRRIEGSVVTSNEAGAAETRHRPDSDKESARMVRSAARAALRRLISRPPLPDLAQSTVWVGTMLILLLLFFSFAAPEEFANVDNLRNITLDGSTLLILAVGATFVIGSGGIDLSIGSILVFAGVVSVKAMGAVGAGGVDSLAIGLVAALLAGLAWGLLNGILVANAGLTPLIVTLGTFAAAYGLTLVLSGGQDLNAVPPLLVDSIGFGRLAGALPYPVVIAVCVAIVGGFVLTFTRFGRYTLVIGSNVEAARRAGIAVTHHTLKLYALSGLLAGLAGFVSLARFSSTTITGHQTDNLLAIVAVVIGGTSLFGGIATMTGTAIGVFIPSVFNNGFVILGLPPYWQQVATGAVLILVVYVDQLRRKRWTR
jgi:ribose transport system permease protein